LRQSHASPASITPLPHTAPPGSVVVVVTVVAVVARVLDVVLVVVSPGHAGHTPGSPGSPGGPGGPIWFHDTGVSLVRHAVTLIATARMRPVRLLAHP
jgi:hypothetical protein